jgi:predicted nucleic acid-binding protein
MLKLAPASLYLRSGDAVHLATALEIGELEVWTSDRHMLAAAPHFGLIGHTA